MCNARTFDHSDATSRRTAWSTKSPCGVRWRYSTCRFVVSNFEPEVTGWEDWDFGMKCALTLALTKAIRCLSLRRKSSAHDCAHHGAI
jgi:hypothetical protein